MRFATSGVITAAYSYDRSLSITSYRSKAFHYDHPSQSRFDRHHGRVMNSLRLRVDNTTEYAKVSAVVNEVYRDIAAKQDWWWLIKRSSALHVTKPYWDRDSCPVDHQACQL